jgi:hypothetical protein
MQICTIAAAQIGFAFDNDGLLLAGGMTDDKFTEQSGAYCGIFRVCLQPGTFQFPGARCHQPAWLPLSFIVGVICCRIDCPTLA